MSGKRIISPTRKDLHAQQVLKDSEFQKKLLSIRDKYAKKYEITDWVRLKELNDSLGPSEIIRTVGKGVLGQRLYLDWEKFKDKEIKLQIQDLAIEYQIDVFWIIECINSPSQIPHYFNKPMIRSRVLVEEDKKSLYIRIWANTQLGDIEAAWPEIEYAKGASYFKIDASGKSVRYKGTKNKVPDEPELIYAIFRSRQEGLTFPQIFRLYQDGKLPRYEGTTNLFDSVKSLESYYDKYKPAI